ncbi:FAD-dependent oxidoreductase [Tengunoibacter tsumagoiensis]|uniref:N-methyl-L-tryptophan oxidase n=1 Tax=Tengunoibacter tsumagoiensis TaxID=2014871 RepID=A0A402A2V7_9CHLR|nr:FAD-dependent oxidoreductase [Tengunoibacter tsumagoiensis]GCE13488.1 N-methyl-L-tryptophan oxidase [Tengunoibacter tsumagoiensis]
MKQQRIFIIGAGIIGLSTAYALLKAGMQKVIVLEQATVDHQRSSSHGISRLLRFEYGDDAFYSQMVHLSLQRWKQLEQGTRRTLYTSTGLLSLGNEDDHFTAESYYTLRDLGYAPERLTPQVCAQRFPQFDLHGYDLLLYNSNAGILHASSCLHTLKECVISLGGQVLEGHQVRFIDHDRSQGPIHLHLSSGEVFQADRIVIAAGPWVHRLLAELQLPVRVTRQYVLYFDNLPHFSFSQPAFPAFIADDLYGFPIHDGSTGWLKATSHHFGSIVDPDDTPLIDEQAVALIAESLGRVLPALKFADVAHIDACVYDVSLDEDFILDRFPTDPRIIFATGLTGHSFKFGLLLGEMLSSLLCEGPSPVPMEPFCLARFSQYLHTPTPSVA